VEGLKLARPEIAEADRTVALAKARGSWLVALGEANLATGHSNAQVREQGIAYLAQSGDERSVVFLITALMDTELHIRQLSLNALFRRGNRVPVQPLVEFSLNDAGAMRSQVVALIRQVVGAGSDEGRAVRNSTADYQRMI
jgi:hypothetical protein